MSYFLIKRDVGDFNALTLVKVKNLSGNGECFLVSDLENDKKCAWVMKYDLYSLVDESQVWDFDKKFDKVMRKLLSTI
jgi:hypothetical protein